jgi:hypothetical protein
MFPSACIEVPARSMSLCTFLRTRDMLRVVEALTAHLHFALSNMHQLARAMLWLGSSTSGPCCSKWAHTSSKQSTDKLLSLLRLSLLPRAG